MEFTEQQLAHIKMVVDYAVYYQIRLTETSQMEPMVVADVTAMMVDRLLRSGGECRAGSQK